jgi:hypothetical protein
MDLDDIDALFGNNSETDTSTFSPDANEVDDSDMSQDDIDALFG